MLIAMSGRSLPPDSGYRSILNCRTWTIATDQYIPIVAAARLLSSIQENQPTRIFPALSQELAKALEPATNRFHSRRQRKRVLDELRRVAKSGRIFELLNAVDNQAMLSADARSFQVAVTEYAIAGEHRNNLITNVRKEVPCRRLRVPKFPR